MMICLPTSRRWIVCAALAAVLGLSSGCSWFRGASGYEQSPEHRPLEIPPDLDQPNTTSAMRVPSLSSSASSAPAAVSSTGFVVADQTASTWRRVGLALERIDGVEIKERAELIGAYTVLVGTQQFLVRVSEDPAGSRVSASDAASQPANSNEASRVLGELKSRLGG